MSSNKNCINSKEVSLFLHKKTVCKLLRISVNELRKRELNDVFFPKKIKTGTSKQCGVKYCYDEIIDWHLKELARRQ